MRSHIPPRGCIPHSVRKPAKNERTAKPVRSVSPHVHTSKPESTQALDALLIEARIQESELLETIQVNPLDEKLQELDRMQHFIRQISIQIAARRSK
jgi:hypothetical protein